MADFPYTPNPASVPKFLDHIQKAGVPQKVTQQYLNSVGFKSTNDRYLIAILKFIGFLDQSAVPTDSWKDYRNKQKGPVVLAASVRSGYTELFDTYPDAHRKDSEALRNFFSTHTSVAETTLGLIVRTFKAFADRADFEKEGGASAIPTSVATPGAATPSGNGGGAGTTININIQLEIPATKDAEVYEKFFAALKKHLF